MLKKQKYKKEDKKSIKCKNASCFVSPITTKLHTVIHLKNYIACYTVEIVQRQRLRLL